jgi:hypothetical protein
MFITSLNLSSTYFLFAIAELEEDVVISEDVLLFKILSSNV